MKNLLLLVFLFVFSCVGMTAGQTVTPSSAPSPVPTASPAESASQKVTYYGSIKFTTGYLGQAGDHFRNSFDQHVELGAEYHFSEKASVYIGAWSSLQTKEYDPYIGSNFKIGRTENLAEYVLIFYRPVNQKIHNFNFESNLPVYQGKQTGVKLYARTEIHKLRPVDQSRSGAYLSLGVKTETKLRRNWLLNTQTSVLRDTGAYGVQPGYVILQSGAFTKQLGRYKVGPGWECVIDINASKGSKCYANMTFSF